MESNPAQSQVSAAQVDTNQQQSTKKYVIIFTILILVAILFFVTYKFFIPKQTDISGVLFADKYIPFSSVEQRTRFDNYLKLANEATDEKEQFDNFFSAFTVLSIDYGDQPDASKRDLLIQIKDYLLQKYPLLSSVVPLQIPCKEESCGAKKEYSVELTSIKAKVATSSSIPEERRETILSNLDNAAFAHGKADSLDEFGSLGAAFANLKSLWELEKKSEIAALVKEVLNIMRSVDKNQYQTFEKAGIYNLE